MTIAGNGRVAGITEAYRRGTANKYKADMVSDAEAVGIDPKIIEGMRQPVLVRLMTDRDASRADIAQLSNETGTKGFDATEQAENDAASIDVAALAFDEEGNITPEAVAQFVALLPDNSGVIDCGGVPNNMARPRLERAIFQRVYGRPYLTSLLTDTEGGGRIVSVLMRVAPKMLQLEESGDLDFRNDLVAAAIEIYPELPPRCRDYAVGAFRTYSLAHFTPRSLYICRCSFTGSPGMTAFSNTFAF